MKARRNFFKNTKNKWLILGLAVAFTLVFQQNHLGYSLLPGQETESGEQETFKDFCKDNLINANFLTAFFSSINSKTNETTCCSRAEPAEKTNVAVGFLRNLAKLK